VLGLKGLESLLLCLTSGKISFEIVSQFIKNRAKYPTCKGGDESPRAEGTKNMI